MFDIFKATASYDCGHGKQKDSAALSGKWKGLDADAVVSDSVKDHRCGPTHPA